MPVLNQPPTLEDKTDTAPDVTRCGRRLVLAGLVQGLGVRPAIFRLATDLGLGGTVRNTRRGVEIELEGSVSDLDLFTTNLRGAMPDGAIVTRLDREASLPTGRDSFTIVKESQDGPLAARVPEDRALCPDCLREISLPFERRYDYPFTSCTQCGPRYTVIRAMPFERQDTSMASFPLCVDCRHEYYRPRDRRFHAQTTGCPVCGPQVWCTVGGSAARLHSEQAIQTTARLLKAGKIVAVRGLGGYQLLVDASSQEAVVRLRERKGRLAKPLAVMVASLAVAELTAHVDANERDALTDPSGPIVLVRAKSSNNLAEGIAPHLDTVGLMLPTTPLHAILARECGRPLVCTSGNCEGDPLEFDVESAEERLAGIADAWLHHNREITRPIDDSVVRVIAGKRVTMRLARGLAPLPLELPTMTPTLAVGGFLKAAVAWSNGAQAVLGPHIGDQETLAARERYQSHLKDWQQLYRFRPDALAHDLHPDYYSTRWANGQRLPTLAIQHHHAHVVAGMLEHGWLDRQVLGVAWDGTGYGPDDTIWGGEFLMCTSKAFERVARLRPFRLPGGEAAIHEPWRTAVSICRQIDIHVEFAKVSDWNIRGDRISSLCRVIDQPQHSPLTSSAGRLFDAAASLILGMTRADFDGQAAMRLEAVADRTAPGAYEAPLDESPLAELDWRPMFARMLDELRRGVDQGSLAMRFHRGLALAIVDLCRRHHIVPVVLTGGVFQSRLLTELVVELWDDPSQPLGLPETIPPNDGGLAAGQLAIAAMRGSPSSCA